MVQIDKIIKAVVTIVALICVGSFIPEVSAGTFKAYNSVRVPSKQIIQKNFATTLYKSFVFARYKGLYKKADNSFILHFTYDEKSSSGKFYRKVASGTLIRLENNNWLFDSRQTKGSYRVLRVPK